MSGVVTVEINTDRLVMKCAKMSAATSRALSRAINRGAFEVQKHAREGIANPPKTGRLYGAASDVAKVERELAGGKKASKAARRRVHRASAPGEYPAGDTGRLGKSVQIVLSRPGPVLESVIWTGVSYAKALEYGTRQIAARPFLRPSLYKARAAIHRFAVAELGAELASGVGGGEAR